MARRENGAPNEEQLALASPNPSHTLKLASGVRTMQSELRYPDQVPKRRARDRNHCVLVVSRPTKPSRQCEIQPQRGQRASHVLYVLHQ